MTNVSISVLLQRACTIPHIISGATMSRQSIQLQSTALSIEEEIHVSTVIDHAKALYGQALHQVSLNSVDRCWQMVQLQHQDYALAP